MAASHANRSPSWIAPGSRPINPSLRNSESNSAAFRRSFSAKPSVLTNARRFDPTTPANSPSDVSRRHSMDSYPKEKENCEKDPNVKASKLQPSVKGSKNFMSPTISAAYKFSPSPKKKTLVERNDPVRTSISLSDGKAMFFSTQSPYVSADFELKSEMGHEKGHRTECSLDLNVADLAKKQVAQESGTRVSKPLKKVTFSDVPSDSGTEFLSESVITESDSSKMSSLKNELPCSWDSSTISPLDADPSLLPYDPKTNYLSPRPLFLHYKPNPRVEILLNKEKGLEAEELKLLEDSLLADILSESFSDSDGAEDTLSEEPVKEELDFLVSEGYVVGVEEGITHSPRASETSESSLPIGTALPNAVSVDNAANERQKKPRLVSRLTCFSMILMLLIACGSVFAFHSPPAFNKIALTEMRFSDVSNLYDQSRLVSASAKRNFDRLARHVNQFSVDSLSYISNLVNEFGKGESIGSLQFMNISYALQNDGWNQGEFLNKEEVSKEHVQDLEEDGWNRAGFLNEGVDDIEEDGEFEDDIDSEETDILDDSEEDDELEEVANAEMGITEEEEEAHSVVGYSDDNLEEFGTGDEVSENIENQIMPDAETDRLGVTLQAQDSELQEAAASEMAEIESQPGNDIGTSPASMDEKIPSGAANSLSEPVQSSLQTESLPSEDKSRIHYVMGLSALIVSLFAAAATYAYHKRNQRMPNVVVHENPPRQCKQMDSKDQKTYSQNWQQTETAFSSETSSFQNTAASYSVKEMREVESEAESTERKTKKYYSKREPLIAAVSAASEFSTGSPQPSYGSFTTFERIPIKNNANRDEEVITPVRRSNRIRNHQPVTSP